MTLCQTRLMIQCGHGMALAASSKSRSRDRFGRGGEEKRIHLEAEVEVEVRGGRAGSDRRLLGYDTHVPGPLVRIGRQFQHNRRETVDISCMFGYICGQLD